MRLLDYGVVCPMIETREECEAFVGACRYPPQGYRSLGPTRARYYAGADYAEHANDTILTFAMIETQKGFDNRDAIMAVDGLDGVFVGISDLRALPRWMGFFGAMPAAYRSCHRDDQAWLSVRPGDNDPGEMRREERCATGLARKSRRFGLR